MLYVWAILVILLLFASQAVNLLGGPANWIVLGLVALWKWIFPVSMPWSFVLILGAMALAGELLEFFLQAWGARRYGASSQGNLGGIIGAIAGAIMGAPILFGLGAILGALAGAYLGCLFFELPGRTFAEAKCAAMGAFWGKAFGFTAKFSIGAAMVVMSIPRIWP